METDFLLPGAQYSQTNGSGYWQQVTGEARSAPGSSARRPHPEAGPYRGLHAVHNALYQPLEIIESSAQAAGRHVLR